MVLVGELSPQVVVDANAVAEDLGLSLDEPAGDGLPRPGLGAGKCVLLELGVAEDGEGAHTSRVTARASIEGRSVSWPAGAMSSKYRVMRLPLFQVDAFADQVFAGNPA